MATMRSAARRIERLRKIVAIGEERGGVAVIAHAEHDGIEDWKFRCYGDILKERHEAGIGGVVLQEMRETRRALERSLVIGTWRSSTSVTVTLSHARIWRLK